MAGGKLPGCKERGEWAELYFMMMVVGLGMKALRLFGDSGRYDVGVENGSRVLRVQVKSTVYKRRGGRLQLECDGAAEEKVCAGVGGLFCGAADSD
jgi:hypothetical protein